MAKNEVNYGYALLDDSKHTVSINDIDQSYTRLHRFYCPHCKKEMYATFGPVNIPHFRHNGNKCQYSKYLHDLAKQVFKDEYDKCLKVGLPFILDLHIPAPCNNACVLMKHVNCKEHLFHKIIDLTKEYTNISLEPKVNTDTNFRRPDVLLESNNGKQLWVEIWVTHETEEDKRKEGRIIEIKIETEKDLDMIREHRIVQSKGNSKAVRIFNIDTDNSVELLKDSEINSTVSYPCDKYFCFELEGNGIKSGIIDEISTVTSQAIKYKVVFRLNWKGKHDTFDGVVGMQTTENELQAVCSNRYKFYREHRFLPQYIPFSFLIEYEHRDTAFQPLQIRGGGPHVDYSNMEWVDLGLPSGTLWAKDSIDYKLNYFETRLLYGAHLPTQANALELKEYCIIKCDYESHALIFIGPNGNSIMFHFKNVDNILSFWLKNVELFDSKCVKCFHIGPDCQFSFEDIELNQIIGIRLVSI